MKEFIKKLCLKRLRARFRDFSEKHSLSSHYRYMGMFLKGKGSCSLAKGNDKQVRRRKTLISKKPNCKVALLCTFSTVPRTYYMAKLLAKSGYLVHVIEWDRSASKPIIENVNGIIFRRLALKAPYGLQAFFGMLIWWIYALVLTLIESYQVIQPQNLDCLIPTLVSSKIIRKRHIIYDLADFYADAYLNNVPIIRKLIAFMERVLIRCVDGLVLVSERQLLQIGAQSCPKHFCILYNIPYEYETKTLSKVAETSDKKNDRVFFTIFYAGILSYDRVRLLMNVAKAVTGLPVKLMIAGFGAYASYIQALSKINKQLIFLGKLDHEKVMMFAKNADAIVLPYDSRYSNYRVALPNKFFEAIISNSLILAPKGTYIAEIVEKEKCGIIIDYNNLEEIRRSIELVINNKVSICSLIKNARMLLTNKFNIERRVKKYIEMYAMLMSC